MVFPSLAAGTAAPLVRRRPVGLLAQDLLEDLAARIARQVAAPWPPSRWQTIVVRGPTVPSCLVPVLGAAPCRPR